MTKLWGKLNHWRVNSHIKSNNRIKRRMSHRNTYIFLQKSRKKYMEWVRSLNNWVTSTEALHCNVNECINANGRMQMRTRNFLENLLKWNWTLLNQTERSCVTFIRISHFLWYGLLSYQYQSPSTLTCLRANQWSCELFQIYGCLKFKPLKNTFFVHFSREKIIKKRHSAIIWHSMQ